MLSLLFRITLYVDSCNHRLSASEKKRLGGEINVRR